MNNIFKTKWSPATQSYVVCSELAKRAGKTVGGAVVLSIISTGVIAAEISPDANGRYTTTTSGEITGIATNTIENNIISVGNGAAVIINGDMTVNSHLSSIDGSNIVTVQGGNASLTAGKFTINGTTAVAGQRLHPYAFLVRNNASANIEDLTVNLKVPHEFTSGDAVGRGLDGGFGIAVGTEHSNSGTSTITVKNANINISNTENSKLGGYYQNPPLFGNTKALHKGGQITGLYVGAKIDSDTTYTSTGLTKILAQDISTDKTAGDYIMGVYVFGPKSKVILNDSDIKVASKGENSFTLKIGNVENNGTNYKGELISNGKMKLDSTEAPNAPTILLVSSDSKLDASAETASANIQSANSAVVFGVTDLVYKNAMGGFLAALGGDLSRNKSAENQSVKLNNAIISTMSENASLIKAASALNVNSLANSEARMAWSNGDFTTKGEFILSGKDSLATAAKNGWLFEAENGSTLDVKIDKEAKVVGQVSKNTSGTLNIELDKATWTLAKKGLNVNSSTVNSIKLKNNAVLDASKTSTPSQAELDAEVNKYQTAFDAAEAALTAAQAELATAQAMPTGTARTRAIRNANNKITRATQDKAAAEPALNAAKAAQATGEQNAAIYFIKLTSNGTDNDGTLVNEQSVINLANENAKDKLTIEGNYNGTKGKLNLDTKLGDDSSATDRLFVTGNTSGNTVISVNNINGKGAFAPKGIKVVQVDGDSAANSFTLENENITLAEPNKHSFIYRLYQGITGVQGDTTGIDTNDWYLRSTCGGGSHSVGSAFATSQYDGLGCITDDEITITESADIGKVEGAGGADTIVIEKDAKVAGDVLGGNNGVDNSANEDAGDTITVTDKAEVAGNVNGEAGNDTITVTTNAKVKGNLLGEEGDDTFEWSGNSTIAGLNGHNGSDKATVSSTKYDGSQKLDGGDDTEIADGFIDTLNLNGVTVTANGGNIANWEVVKLASNANLTLEDTLATGSGKDNAGNTLGLHIDNSSTLSANSDVTISGDVHNSGKVDLIKNNTPAQTLTIKGDYIGTTGSKVLMNTVWNASGGSNGENSTSDVLSITGKATGSTEVVAGKADGTVKIIDGSIKQVNDILNTIPVVKVGVSGERAFTGTANTSGAGEVQLAKRTVNGVDEYYWTIAALQPTDPVKPAEPNKPITPIYNPTVPAYTLAAKAGLELGYTTLATLHERRGENQTLAWDECGTCGEKADGQSWARVFGKRLDLDGKTRLNADHRIYGFQLGLDFSIQRTDEGGHRLTGAYVSYGVMKSDYFDLYRAVNGVISDDKFTGTGKQYGWNLGLTHTRYAPNGAYVDLVGQIGFLRNKYNARNGVEAKQRGTSLALSVEVGRPYALAEHKTSEGVWMIEPQAQLVYQALKLNSFNDGTRQVQGDTHHGLRGRVGVRLAYNTQAAENKYRTNTVYAIANILQDFKGSKAVYIGSDQVKEVNAKTWFEIGLGGQLLVGKQSYLYADSRYERSLGGAKREGYRGTVGFKYTWK